MDHARVGLARSTTVDHRALTGADAGPVAALLEACDIAVLGRPDFTFTEVEGDLRRPDLQHVGWYDGQGTLVAYGWVGREGDSSKVQLDAYVHPQADGSLGLQVLGDLEARGLELAAGARHDHALFDIGAYRQDARTQGWLRQRGYTVGATFTRMRIDLDRPAASEPARPGVVVRESDRSERDLRTAHRLDDESFREHYGHVPKTFDRFRQRLEQHAPGWSRLWLADVDGEPAGLLVGTRQFVEDENAGYVRTLGVTPAARGRGVARRLLRAYFAACRDEGRGAVLLHVDVANVTGALALYESVGMRPVLQIDAWAKRSVVAST